MNLQPSHAFAFLATGALAFSGLALGQQEPPKPGGPGPRPDTNANHPGVRIHLQGMNHGDLRQHPAPKMEMQAFLGVATTPVDSSLRAQVGLDHGFGLVVQHIDPNGAADDALEVHDILTKFEDQRLINQAQLAALVRSAGKDTKVRLTFIRGGKEQSASVTLTERELPVDPQMRADLLAPHEMFQFTLPGRGGQPMNSEALERQMQKLREQMERLHRAPNRGTGPGPGPGPNANRPPQPPGDARAGANSVTSSSTSTMRNATWVENGLVLNLTEDNNGKRLTIDRDGKRLFEGPINSDAEREKIPEDLRESVESLEKRLGGAPNPPAAAGDGDKDDVL